MSTKLNSDVWNDEYIILYFGGRIMSGFKIIEGPPKLPPAPEKEFKKRTESQVQISAGADPHRFPHCKVIKYTRDCLKANTDAEY